MVYLVFFFFTGFPDLKRTLMVAITEWRHYLVFLTGFLFF